MHKCANFDVSRVNNSEVREQKLKKCMMPTMMTPITTATPTTGKCDYNSSAGLKTTSL